MDSEKNMVYLYIGFGKTNQFGRKDIVIPIPGNNDPALDPVRHFEAMFNNYKPTSDEPAFSYRSGKFVTYTKFTSRLKSLLSQAGIQADLYSGHSFRRGGATFLHNCGGTALMIQSAGDWSSLCFTRYLYLTEAERLKSQQVMSFGISNYL